MKKIWLFVIAMAFFFMIPSFSVSAEGRVYDEASLREAISSGREVYLESDIEITSPIKISKDIQIYGNYHTVYNSSGSVFVINDGSVSFKEIGLESQNALVVNDGEVCVDDTYINGYNSSIVLYNGKFIVGTTGLYLDSNSHYIDFSDNSNGEVDIVLYGDIDFNSDLDNAFYIDVNAPKINIENSGNEYKFKFLKNKLVFDGDYYTLYSNEVNDNTLIFIDGKKYTYLCIVTTEEEFRDLINKNKSIQLGADITLTSPFNVDDRHSVIYGDGWAIRQNEGAIFSISGNSDIVFDSVWFIGLGQLEINDGATVTYQDMETFDNPSTLNLNGGTLIIKELRLYKDFNININKGYNTISNGPTLIFENSEPIQSWLQAKLNINISDNVLQLRLSSENSVNKFSLNGNKINVDVLDKTTNKVVTTESNSVNCVSVNIDGNDDFVGDKTECKVDVEPEVVDVPDTGMFNTVFRIVGILIIVVGIFDIVVNLRKKESH